MEWGRGGVRNRRKLTGRTLGTHSPPPGPAQPPAAQGSGGPSLCVLLMGPPSPFSFRQDQIPRQAIVLTSDGTPGSQTGGSKEETGHNK